MVRRRPSDPPILPGFSHVRVLGSGGFADVFLYEQNMPRRQVAVKVLLSDVVTEHVRQMFQVEANLMAQLSSHPSILTVYQASISADGRPYLVMELCSAQLASRYRAERIPVAEVLGIGVRIGGAIETAHRQGVLHRDIKPSNIMLTAYGHPVLSDFGIASSLNAATTQESVGMSIPWSAPEVLLDETTGSVQSEVWSLAATLYTLLAGRSPFEVVEGSNASEALIGRISRARVPSLDRDDVPESLETVLRRALNRAPARRHSSVLELVRDLQRVEAELGLTPTQADVAMDDWAIASAGDPHDRTIVRAAAGKPSGGARGRRLRRRRAVAAAPEPEGASPRTAGVRRVRQSRMIAAALLVIAIVVVGLGATATLSAIQAADGSLPRVSNVEAAREGSTIIFSWSDPGLAEGDVYQVQVDGGATTLQRTAEFAVAVVEGDTVCVTVSVAREGRVGAPSDEKCAVAE
ncbi:MAG: serine/threonine protein kinase [Leifsonia sp.]|uniref:non-specific serine/threonine protein kinase n=1 Tax=Microcella pacifica TaxID=2591847 RepID=A0A9E5MHX8_9MICO|nr:serine/threonine-protein kinase [Microcella pacifica]MBR21457.1 serine/threonine protein kinase [Leifsonia sp.]NHF62930.1 serine/threonine protein kinase [Microcella pacifica]